MEDRADVVVTGRPNVVVSMLAGALEALAWSVRRDDEASTPDIVVVVGLGRGVPPEIEEARRSNRGVGIVWVAGMPTGREVADAVAAGCSCVVSEQGGVDDVVTAIRHALDGTAWTTPDLVDTVMGYIRAPVERLDEPLTPREAEVLELLRLGRSTRDIGDELSISAHTAKNHIRRILNKLGVHSRLEAVAVIEGRRPPGG